MRLDFSYFSLLSMTELRNRPGEILDRVADKGEAFTYQVRAHRKLFAYLSLYAEGAGNLNLSARPA